MCGFNFQFERRNSRYMEIESKMIMFIYFGRKVEFFIVAKLIFELQLISKARI